MTAFFTLKILIAISLFSFKLHYKVMVNNKLLLVIFFSGEAILAAPVDAKLIPVFFTKRLHATCIYFIVFSSYKMLFKSVI